MTLSAQLTHFGVHTTDLDRMVDFYTRVMGFVVSDSGTGRSGARVAFMTQNPECHHQFVLFDGRPQELAYNPVNQISFRLDSLDTLKGYRRALLKEGISRAPDHRPRQCLGALFQGSRGQPGRALCRHAVLHAAALRRAARPRPAERRDPAAHRSDVPRPAALHESRGLDAGHPGPAGRTLAFLPRVARGGPPRAARGHGHLSRCS